jgi:hypothetical protein
VQLLTHAASHIRVQIAEGFVKQQDDGVLDQRPGKRHPLLLAPGQLVGVPAFEPFQADKAQHIVDTDFSVMPAKVAKSERNVVLNAQVWKQRILLEDHSDVPVFGGCHMIGRRHQVPGQEDLSGPNRLEPGDGTQNGGLAAT